MPAAVTVASVATAVFEELSKLQGDERKRALHGALAMLGDPAPAPAPAPASASGGGGGGGAGPDGGGGHDQSPDTTGFPAKARTWMRQQQVTPEHLGHVFHVDGSTVELIAASVPGGSKAKQMMAVYLLKGIAGLLASGEPKFGDKEARAAAENLGCYDQPNHSSNFKREKSNHLTGSKADGWTLTGPGQKAAADLIKSMQPAA